MLNGIDDETWSKIEPRFTPVWAQNKIDGGVQTYLGTGAI